MKRTYTAIFTAIILSLLISLGGCENKSDKSDTTLPIENTTDVTPTSTTGKEGKTENSKIPFNGLINLRGDRYGISITKDRLMLQPNDKPLVLINLFDIEDNDSIAQLPYLEKLQDKFSDRLLVVSIPVNTPLNKEKLNRLVQKMKLKYFISFGDHHQEIGQMFLNALQSDTLTLPTTLLYDQEGTKQGFYEGLTPYEMISFDILSLSKQ